MASKLQALWSTWLEVVLVGVALFSIILIVAPDITTTFFNLLVFSGSPPDVLMEPEVVAYLQFVYGLMGAVMLGWCVSLYYLVHVPFRDGERWAWTALATSITVWFCIDSVHSILAGFWQNALFNVVFFVAFAIPLATTFSSLFPA